MCCYNLSIADNVFCPECARHGKCIDSWQKLRLHSLELVRLRKVTLLHKKHSNVPQEHRCLSMTTVHVEFWNLLSDAYTQIVWQLCTLCLRQNPHLGLLVVWYLFVYLRESNELSCLSCVWNSEKQNCLARHLLCRIRRGTLAFEKFRRAERG